MCVLIAVLSLMILNSLHHEVQLSSHHRSYSHIIISIHYTTLHYTILTCSSICVDGSSSSSGSSGIGSESCIIVLYRCIDIDVYYNSSSQSSYFKFSSSRSGRKLIHHF